MLEALFCMVVVLHVVELPYEPCVSLNDLFRCRVGMAAWVSKWRSGTRSVLRGSAGTGASASLRHAREGMVRCGFWSRGVMECRVDCCNSFSISRFLSFVIRQGL